jgi:MFS family permease
MFANTFAALTGGVFLTGFALQLGMSDFMIGLLAAMPFIATLFQIPISYSISKFGRRKQTAIWAAFLARSIWLPVLLVAVFPLSTQLDRNQVVLWLLFVSYACVSVSYVAWLSWMSDLVPDDIRGRFFGTRNMLCGAAGMFITVVFGKLLDKFNAQMLGTLPTGFAVTFISAVILGLASLHYMKRIPEPSPAAQGIRQPSFQESIALPFREPNFNRFLAFALLWGFAVNVASPFFTLYFLRDLSFSYGFVAFLAVLSAFADLVGMQIWGRISDKVKNKAVIQFAGWVAIFLPLAWVTVRPDSLIIPIVLHLVGGGFWAGIHLCLNNLLLRIAHKDNKTFFFSMYNIAGGLGAGTAPILAGLVVQNLPPLDLQILSWKMVPLHILFLTSTLLRLLSFQLLQFVREPDEAPAEAVVRIIRSLRGLNVATGFNYLLHPFSAVAQEAPKRLQMSAAAQPLMPTDNREETTRPHDRRYVHGS